MTMMNTIGVHNGVLLKRNERFCSCMWCHFVLGPLSNYSPACNMANCRLAIISYLLTNTSYNTSSMNPGQGCSGASQPNFHDWSSRWKAYDFVVFTVNGTDVSGKSRNNTLLDCQRGCLGYSACVGFSREKASNDSASGLCFFKVSMTILRRTFNDSIYGTLGSSMALNNSAPLLTIVSVILLLVQWGCVVRQGHFVEWNWVHRKEKCRWKRSGT